MDPRRAYFQYRTDKLKKARIFILLLAVVLAIAVLQDYLQASYRDFSFYLSESLLFNLFWVVILPVTFVLRYLFRKVSLEALLPSKWMLRGAFVLLATVLHVISYSFLVFAISSLFYQHTFGFAGNLAYTLSEDLYKYLFVYAALSLIPFQNSRVKPDQSSPVTRLHLQSGRKSEWVDVSEVLYITSAAPYVEIITDGKKYLQADTLKSLLLKLDPSTFVRIHKSTIVNLEKVSSLKSRLNGDYDVQLISGHQLRLSRNYLQSFRKVFGQQSSA